MTACIGGADTLLSPSAIDRFIAEQFAGIDLDDRSLCLVIPDATRVCPLPALLASVHAAVRRRVRSCTAVVALGTHPPLSRPALHDLVGTDELTIVNHEWWEESTFATVGSLGAGRIAELSDGRLSLEVAVRVNRLVLDSDVTVMIGPVLPHEVVGFSGGNKYLFPGLSGPEMIDVSHWLGALVTSREIIGTTGPTPVRALIDAAAELVPGERHALCIVGDRGTGGLRSIAFGEPRQAWAAAAAIAAETHIVHHDEPVERVISVVPPRYGDLWTGAKGFYKVEPIVADGGEVVLYAPHITEISVSHPRLSEIGYHCRDFFIAHWDEYRDHPWGELAHSTHLFGAGVMGPDGQERQRVRVTLATGIPEAVVRRANLHHLDASRVDLEALSRTPGTLVVPDAGEVLHRLRRA